MLTSKQLHIKYLSANLPLVILAIIFGLSSSFFNGVSTALVIPTILLILNQNEAIKNINFLNFLSNYLDKFPEQTKIILMVLAVFSMIILKNLTNFLTTAINLRLNLLISKTMLYEAIQNLTKVSIDYYHQEQIGTIISDNTGEIFKTANIIKAKVELLIISLTILSFTWVLLSISWQLTILATLIIGIIIVLNQFIIKKSKYYGILLTEKIREFSNNFIEFLMGIRLIKIVNTESKEYQKLRDIYDVRETLQYKSQLLSSLIGPVNDTLGIFLILTIIVVGRYLFLNQFQSLASLILIYLAILFRLIPYFNQLNNLRSQFAKESASVQRVVNLLNKNNKVFLKNGTKIYQPITREIRFESVEFTYPGSQQPVLKGIDLVIPKGKTTALVGTSGAGKSTITDLMIRFYDPTQGRISLDGVDLRDFEIESLHQHMGVVSQDTFLFNNTVSYNIAYGLENVEEAEIITAAKRANAYEFIVNLSEGFKTKIGDRGVLLSGGQKQRLAIARALLRNPDILILDEATSALDTVSEKMVQEAINELCQNRTTIVIAHRLSTIQQADQIVVLEKGKILEVGNHRELLEKRGKYADLYSLNS